MQKYPELSPTAIDYIWQNAKADKLAGGTYCAPLQIDGQSLYLVNGFHPRQLEHYETPGRSIIAFTLKGNLNWEAARNRFIGKTNPADAALGSIRRSLLEKKDSLGLPSVNSSWNGVHLSAGPVEGLIELIRYNTDFSGQELLSHTDFSFGQQLANRFNSDTVGNILSNAKMEINDHLESVFDVTEEKDAEQAIELLAEGFNN
jgi:hypothetical protein